MSNIRLRPIEIAVNELLNVRPRLSDNPEPE